MCVLLKFKTAALKSQTAGCFQFSVIFFNQIFWEGQSRKDAGNQFFPYKLKKKAEEKKK